MKNASFLGSPRLRAAAGAPVGRQVRVPVPAGWRALHDMRRATGHDDGNGDGDGVQLADPLLTAAQAAVVLGGVPAKTVLQLAREGRLPCVRIGRHVRFSRVELEREIGRRRAI